MCTSVLILQYCMFRLDAIIRYFVFLARITALHYFLSLLYALSVVLCWNSIKSYLKLVTIFVNVLLAISIRCPPMFVFPPSFGVCLSALPIGVGVYLVLICVLFVVYGFRAPCWPSWRLVACVLLFNILYVFSYRWKIVVYYRLSIMAPLATLPLNINMECILSILKCLLYSD
jgi:hypothetical protein